MKSTLTKQLTTVLMLMAFSMTTMAQTAHSKFVKTERDETTGAIFHHASTSLDNHGVAVKRRNDPPAIKPLNQKKKSMAKDEGNMLKLSISLTKHDDISEYPYAIYMFKTNPNEYIWLEMIDEEDGSLKDFADFDVPAGTYNFLAEFYRIDADGFDYNCYVIKENVTIKSDMTLNFDAYEAKNFVDMNTFDKNGNQVILPRGHYTSEGEFEWIGDWFELFMGNGILSYEGYGMLSGWCGNTNYISKFYISDVSEKVSYSLVEVFSMEGMLYTVNHYADQIVSNVQTSNDPKDFIVYDETFKPTPLNAESERIPYPVITVEGAVMMLYGHEMPDGKLTLCIGKAPRKKGQFLIDIASADYAGTEEEDFGDGDIWYISWEQIMRSLPILNFDGKLSYYNLGQTSFFREDRVYEIDGERKTMGLFPSNPVFSYPLSQRVAPMIGNSCPMLDVDLLHYPYYDGDGALKQIDVFYKGRYGEQRESDNMVAHLLIKEGDEVVYDDALQGSTGYMWLDPHWDNGIVDVTLTNENIDVDGLQGKNVTTLQLDKAKADRCPPSLSMLDFRDKDNMVTDRFATAADGKLNFYAYDNNFNVTEDWQYYWTVFKPTVEVSYTPYDTEDWKPLPVEEDPSLFFLPTMGYFYSGSLKDVTGAGREGWFDLKIRLEDEAGNWQEQVISPAFRIDDLVDTGISDEELRMKDDNLKATTVYDLQGRMNNIGCCNKGVSIIRKKNGDVCKVVVR